MLASVVRHGRLGIPGQKIVATQAQAGHPLFMRVEGELQGSSFMQTEQSIMHELDMLLLYRFGSTSSMLAKKFYDNCYDKLKRAIMGT